MLWSFCSPCAAAQEAQEARGLNMYIYIYIYMYLFIYSYLCIGRDTYVSMCIRVCAFTPGIPPAYSFHTP